MKHVVILIIVVMRQLFIELWYSPILFARHWTAGTNKSPEHLKQKDPVSVITSVVVLMAIGGYLTSQKLVRATG